MRRLAFTALVFAVGALCGCSSSFEAVDRTHRSASRVQLIRSSLDSLSGRYAFAGERLYCSGCQATTFSVRKYVEVAHASLQDSIRSFTLTVRNEHAIEVAVEENGSVIDEWVVKGEVGEDGYFVTWPKSKAVPLIGPLVWALRSITWRLSKTDQGDLVVDAAHTGVGYLILIPFGGANHYNSYLFRRIE